MTYNEGRKLRLDQLPVHVAVDLRCILIGPGLALLIIQLLHANGQFDADGGGAQSGQRLNLVVLVPTMLTVEVHDDNLAEIGNLRGQQLCHAVLQKTKDEHAQDQSCDQRM